MLFFRKKKAEEQKVSPPQSSVQQVKSVVEGVKLPKAEDIEKLRSEVWPTPPQPVEATLEKVMPSPTVPIAPKPPAPPPPQVVQQKAPAQPQLFVKIDRYRNILDTLNYLRNTMRLTQQSFSILAEIERTRTENIKLIQNALAKVNNKLKELHNELKPVRYQEAGEEVEEVQQVGTAISDLQEQIEQLKLELEQS
jgi:hypothetical protein